MPSQREKQEKIINFLFFKFSSSIEEFRRKEEAQEIEERENSDQPVQRSSNPGQEQIETNSCEEQNRKSPPKLFEEISGEDLIQNLEQLSEEGENFTFCRLEKANVIFYNFQERKKN